MITAATAIGFLFIIVVNTVITAVTVRFFRMRLETRWGAVLYTLLLMPLVYVATTLVLSGVVGLGGSGVNDRGTALVLVWMLPFTLGISIDLFWIPPPDEIDLPDEPRREQQSR